MSIIRKELRKIKRHHLANLQIFVQAFYNYINDPVRHPDEELREFATQLIFNWNKYCDKNNLTDSYKNLLIDKIKIKWELVTKTKTKNKTTDVKMNK